MQMHGHFKTETNNTSCKGNTALWQLPTRKIRKFIKSKFKILTCVVLLGRLNTMRGISAGKYDKGNKNIMMRGIWVEEIWNIYCCQVYISIVSASHYPVTVKTTTNFSNICYLLSDFCTSLFYGRFQPVEMQLWPSCFFKVYATHCLMWPPLWYNSKLAKNIPLFFNPYPFIQKSTFKYFIMLHHA